MQTTKTGHVDREMKEMNKTKNLEHFNVSADYCGPMTRKALPANPVIKVTKFRIRAQRC